MQARFFRTCILACALAVTNPVSCSSDRMVPNHDFVARAAPAGHARHIGPAMHDGAIGRSRRENAVQIVAKHSRSPISEAYRPLRTNVCFTSLDKPLRTTWIASNQPWQARLTWMQ
jgi:hypothetical protein